MSSEPKQSPSQPNTNENALTAAIEKSANGTACKKVTHTIKLRIIRPFYPKEVENEIKVEKEKRKNAGKTSAIPWNDPFWNSLSGSHPEIITWGEFGPLLRQLQRKISETYNYGISYIYHLILNGSIRKVSIKTLGSQVLIDGKTFYKFSSERLQNSNLALGIGTKVASNLGGQKTKELWLGRMALPTARNTFPIPFGANQENPFSVTVEEAAGHPDDFVIELRFPKWGREKLRTEKELVLGPLGKTEHLKLLLSTSTRNRQKRNDSTAAEIRKLMNGEVKVSSLELVPEERYGGGTRWFCNMSLSYSKPVAELDPNVTGGIDVGVGVPFVCAVSNSLKRLVINGSTVFAMNKRFFSRRRLIASQTQGKQSRSGHGRSNKLHPLEFLTRRNEERRKKLIEQWAARIAEFFIREKTGVVYIENLQSMKENDDEESFFNRVLRGFWPYSAMQGAIKRKLEEAGITVKEVSPRYTSKICSACGKYNKEFSFKRRTQEGFPQFKCSSCKNECGGDYNAAHNLSLYPQFQKALKAAANDDPSIRLAEEE